MEAQVAGQPSETFPAPPEPAAQVTVAGNELQIFIESGPLITAMVDDIRRATKCVWLETYIFYHDSAGRAVADALIDRARAGLDVRLLYDAIGSQTTPSWFFRAIKQAGGKVHCFHSLWEAFFSLSPFRILNRRNHRKLLVVDERVAYFGGMNVIDQSLAGKVAETDQLPLSGGWRDVHVRLLGPDQSSIADSFSRSWRRALGEKIGRRPRTYRQAVLQQSGESIQFFDSGPGLKHTRAARVVNQLFDAARKSLTMSMAYFLPVGGVLRHLLAAHRRGVFVRVVVPGASDVALVQHATRYLYHKLLRRRFHIYERQQHMLHSKVLVVDGQWTMLGSCNLDARSLFINLEFMAVIHSATLARVMTGIIEREIDHSHRIRMRELARLSWWQRIVDRAAWALRWWL
jgi:cardiolipin synthase A/B